MQRQSKNINKVAEEESGKPWFKYSVFVLPTTHFIKADYFLGRRREVG